MIGSVSVILAAASMQVLPACSWDHPGARPYMGDIPAAVEHYSDIPAATRAKLRSKMQRRQYDDVATITRDGIESKSATYANLRDMHFGGNRLCRTVTTTKWTHLMKERGLVYCADGHCILVPTVCRNVSRIDATPRPPPKPPAPPGPTEPLQPPTLAEATPVPPGSFNALQQPETGPHEAPPGPELAGGGGPFVHYVLVPLPPVMGGGGSPPATPPLHTVEPPPTPPIHTVEPPPFVTPVPPAPIPEPSALALITAGLGLIVYRRWRRG